MLLVAAVYQIGGEKAQALLEGWGSDPQLGGVIEELLSPNEG